MHPVRDIFFYETPQKFPKKFQFISFFFGFDWGIILYSMSLTKSSGFYGYVSVGWLFILGVLLEGGLKAVGMTTRVG